MITSWLISRLEYDTQQQNGVHDESFFSRREKLTVVYKMAPRKPNHRVYPRIASRQRAIFKKNSRHVLRKVLLYLLVQAMLLLSPSRKDSQHCFCKIQSFLSEAKITLSICSHFCSEPSITTGPLMNLISTANKTTFRRSHSRIVHARAPI